MPIQVGAEDIFDARGEGHDIHRIFSVRLLVLLLLNDALLGPGALSLRLSSLAGGRGESFSSVREQAAIVVPCTFAS